MPSNVTSAWVTLAALAALAAVMRMLPVPPLIKVCGTAAESILTVVEIGRSPTSPLDTYAPPWNDRPAAVAGRVVAVIWNWVP